MSFIRWRRRWQRGAKIVLLIIAGIFLVGCFISFGSSTVTWMAGASPPTKVATVNGAKITRDQFLNNYYQNVRFYLQNPSKLDPSLLSFWKTQTLDKLIDTILLEQEARRRKLKVSSQEVDQEVERLYNQQLSFEESDRRRLKRQLESEHLTYEQFKRRISQWANSQRKSITHRLLMQKLQDAVFATVSVTDEDLKEDFQEVHARHILIRIPSQSEWPSEKGAYDREKARAEAKQRAEDLLKQLREGADFTALAVQHSQDPESKQKGGDLGFFKRHTRQEAFERVAFSLKPGELCSAPVETLLGFHIIQTLGKRENLPADFEKRKAQLREQKLTDRRSQAWQDLLDSLRKKAKIQITDPELSGYQLQAEGKYVEAQAQFLKALRYMEADRASQEALPTVYAGLAHTYQEQKNYNQAIDYYRQAIRHARYKIMLRLDLAELYQQVGQKELALRECAEAAAEAGEEPDAVWVHSRLAAFYKRIGQDRLAEQETKIVQRIRERQESQGPAGISAAPITQVTP